MTMGHKFHGTTSPCWFWARLCLRMVTSLMLTSQCCIHLVLGSILGYLKRKHLRLIATWPWTDNKSHNVTLLWKSWLQACDHKPLPLTPHTFYYRSVDQCTDGTDNCDANAMCTCNNGFTGDGVTCSKWQLMLISDMENIVEGNPPLKIMATGLWS